MLATDILLIACVDPGRCDKNTRRSVLSMCIVMMYNVATGLTSVAMLGKIGLCNDGDEIVDKYTSVKMY